MIDVFGFTLKYAISTALNCEMELGIIIPAKLLLISKFKIIN